MIFKIKPAVRPSDPLIVNRMEDVAYIAFWTIYALWGLAASILGIATITKTAGPVYNFLWSGAIGTLSTIAALSALSLFFKLPGRHLAPPMKKTIEMWAVRILLPLIAVYPALLFITAFAEADFNRGVSAVLALSYLVFPFYRQYSLRRRIKNFKRAATEIVSNGHN